MYQPEPGDHGSLIISAPDDEDPDVPYKVTLWVDYNSDDFDAPFTAGSVIPVRLIDPEPLPSSITVDFYDE